jgi:hypothetical protein
MYCSLAQARDAGATGTDVEITAAITAAASRVNRYTGELFEPTTLTLQLLVDTSGVARVGLRVRTVSSVSWLGVPTPIDPTAIVVSSSSVRGARDEIRVAGSLSWADVTVLGAEPWNGGYANLSTAAEPTVLVTGSFGWDAPPLEVVQATAILAAMLRGADRTPDPAGEPAAATLADPEGNVLPVVPPFTSSDVEHAVEAASRVRSRTTGDVQADALLSPFVREPVRLRA